MGGRWARRIGTRVGAPPQLVGAGAAVLALATAMSGIFGGFREAAPEGPPTVAVGTMDTGRPWNVTVVSARYTTDASPLRLQKPGDRWLVIQATVEITADESRSDIRDVLRLRQVPGLIGKSDDLGVLPDIVYLRAENHVDRLHPNIPEKLLFFWEQAGDTELPREVEIAIIGKTERTDSLTGHLSWLDPETRALVRPALKNAEA